MKYLALALLLSGCASVGKGGLLTGDEDAVYVKKECFTGRGNIAVTSIAANANAMGDITIYGVVIKGDPTQATIDKVADEPCPETP